MKFLSFTHAHVIPKMIEVLENNEIFQNNFFCVPTSVKQHEGNDDLNFWVKTTFFADYSGQ